MALSAPRLLFGIHSISPYSRTDKTPYGILKVVGACDLAMSSSIDELFGGSSRYAWGAEAKTIQTEFAAKVKAFPGFLFQLFLGGSYTDNSAETGASVTTLTNYKGTSCKNSTTGVASVGVKSGSTADVKFGNYMVKVASATTVDVYLLSDVDIARGTAGSYSTDTLKAVASLTITASTAVTITGHGLELTGGSGTIGMTTGDTAYFTARPINTGSTDIVIGAVASTAMPAFGCVMVSQKRDNGEMFEIEAYNCAGVGLPISLNEMAWSVTDIKVSCLYDTTQDRVFSIRTVIPSTFN